MLESSLEVSGLETAATLDVGCGQTRAEILNSPRKPVCQPMLMAFTLVLADTFSLVAATIVAVWCLQGMHWQNTLAQSKAVAPFLVLLLLFFSALELYSGISPSSPEELRRTTLACVTIGVCFGTRALFLRETDTALSWLVFTAMLISVAAVPLVRECVRFSLGGTAWWGYPAVVWGDSASIEQIVRNLKQQSPLGLKPIAVVCTEPTAATCIEGVPVFKNRDLADWKECLTGRTYAICAATGADRKRCLDAIAPLRSLFRHVLIVPPTWEFCCFWVRQKNLGGLLGLEIKEMARPSRQVLKRSLDLLITGILLIFLLPLLVAIAIAIKLDSPGPIFFSQRRIGRGAREFSAWKFRSMVINADSVLTRYLEEHPTLRAEWQQSHKIKQDPRITRVGRFLRNTSLDEIPQLWNVLRGDMSLVGPRPIVREEIVRYGEHFDLYTSVYSGLTGLWQVSGRSETSYEQRVDFDAIYVRNWSVWLDVCILFRTIGVLWLRTGAY